MRIAIEAEEEYRRKIIKEAQSKYKIGCLVKSLGTGLICEYKGGFRFNYVGDLCEERYPSGACLYNGIKWAEVIL